MEDFKVQDSVQLLHGYTPTMTIAEINLVTGMALCVWYDAHKTRTINPRLDSFINY